MPYLVKSTSIVSKSVIRRYNRVNLKVKVNLGQPSCYFNLRSSFQLDLPKSQSTYMFRCVLKRETRWSLNYSAIFLSSKVICENGNSWNRYLFFFDPTWRVNICPEEVNSDTIGPRFFTYMIERWKHFACAQVGDTENGSTDLQHVFRSGHELDHSSNFQHD